jgi:hypothetical protein
MPSICCFPICSARANKIAVADNGNVQMGNAAAHLVRMAAQNPQCLADRAKPISRPLPTGTSLHAGSWSEIFRKAKQNAVLWQPLSERSSFAQLASPQSRILREKRVWDEAVCLRQFRLTFRSRIDRKRATYFAAEHARSVNCRTCAPKPPSELKRTHCARCEFFRVGRCGSKKLVPDPERQARARCRPLLKQLEPVRPIPQGLVSCECPVFSGK